MFQQGTNVGRLTLRGNGRTVVDLGDGSDESFIDLKQLGIGVTSNLGAELDVSGSVRISGNLEVNTHTNGDIINLGCNNWNPVTPTMNDSRNWTIKN